MKQTLSPKIDDLMMECVLVQAWKKTSTYIRQHNWYADTLELDYQSLRLPSFIAEIQQRLRFHQEWVSKPLDLVPAPKSQRWELLQGKTWRPKQCEKATKKLRPLAHIDLQDQVVATAMMMCLADRVETNIGDPRLSMHNIRNQNKVLAYGHRLFCDADVAGTLTHRWGSSKIYRQFFCDYQAFLARPKTVLSNFKAMQEADEFAIVDSELSNSQATQEADEFAIVDSDLSKFYDRVRPALLHAKVRQMQQASDDPAFFSLFERVFNWKWRDKQWIEKYGIDNEIDDFSSVALPQGLVAAGFFANVVLQDFGSALRNAIGTPFVFSWCKCVIDACYYVDDLRIVLQIVRNTDEKCIETGIREWLQTILDDVAPGLQVDKGKTKATVDDREQRFLVQQSKAANRIQHEVSGVFDMLHGTELIGAIEGFFQTQQRYTSSVIPEDNGRSGLLVGISDLRDDTATRFAAGKFRRVFRSLRPLLGGEDSRPIVGTQREEEDEESDDFASQLVLSRQQLDEKAQLFSAMLIEEWVSNPGNVRLLRIALDMYPEAKFLEQVLKLLRDGWAVNGNRGLGKDVRLYCLAELFRAGATETGIVNDEDCLPSGVSILDYHKLLEKEALAIFKAYAVKRGGTSRLPWFVMQQVFLYMAVRGIFPPGIQFRRQKNVDRLARYKQLARFLTGSFPFNLHERTIYLTLSVSAFGHREVLTQMVAGTISPDFLRTIAETSPEIAESIWTLIANSASTEQEAVAKSLGLIPTVPTPQSLSTVGSLAKLGQNPFYEEENLLWVADALLAHPYSEWPSILTPWQVNCSLLPESERSMFGRVDRKSIALSDRLPLGKHLFATPTWCQSDEEKQRYKLGMVLRYALRSSMNFHAGVARHHASSSTMRYGTPISHWEKQRHSSFQGRSSFGAPWLPISSVIENLLFELLRWPGCGVSSPIQSIEDIRYRISNRLLDLKTRRGKATKLMFLEQVATWPGRPPAGEWERPLRVGLVQSIIPDLAQYAANKNDPELLSDPRLRRQQRAHLATLLEGVSQMLRVRQTHCSATRQDGRILDLLVFPELAVHSLDVDALLLPFVRTYKCMVLCGLVYHAEKSLRSAPLINSCLWLIPEWTLSSGFQVRRFEQGKEHLASGETSFNPPIQNFRPVQWQVEYQWHSSNMGIHRPLVLSASICYDATDLELASDLRNRNDFFIVCALNQDVGTFDRMVEGLHYHMYQAVMIVNNGQFGGSSLFFPFKEQYNRQVLHLHGQPQATIAFADICPQKLITRPQMPGASGFKGTPEGVWKGAPAGWKKL